MDSSDTVIRALIPKPEQSAYRKRNAPESPEAPIPRPSHHLPAELRQKPSATFCNFPPNRLCRPNNAGYPRSQETPIRRPFSATEVMHQCNP